MHFLNDISIQLEFEISRNSFSYIFHYFKNRIRLYPSIRNYRRWIHEIHVMIPYLAKYLSRQGFS